MSDTHPVYPHVFQPVTIGHTEIRNRVFVPAHTTSFGQNNLPSERHLAYHRERARGGTGLIIFEGIRVHRSSLGRSQGVNGYEPEAVPAFARIAETIHAEGAKFFGQIIHLGRHIDGNFTRTPAWSASAIPWTATAPAPHPMSLSEIAEVVEAHADVAANLIEAGLDGIELQMAHGHLLQQFLSPISNLRTDPYGGSPENRMRFARETLVAVRNRIGADATLGIRISADEFIEGGLTLSDMCKIVPALCRTAQVDFVNVSHSAYHGSYTISTQMADMAFSLGQFQPLTSSVRRAISDLSEPPVLMTVCRYREVAEAEAMLASGATDLVGMARAHIADPEIVGKARKGREAETTPCISCNQGCAGMLPLNLPITCVTNPRVGREAEWPGPAPGRAARIRRVLVVGGGPAGMEAAWVAAARGHEVTLWEGSSRLGGAIRWCETMPLRRDFTRLIDGQAGRLDEHGVNSALDTRATAEDIAAFEADALVIATGAEPAAQPLPGGRYALTMEAALADPDALGQRVLVVDALGVWSVAGVAEHLADLGKQVIIAAPTGAPAWTISMYSVFALKDRLKRKGVRVIAGYALADHADGVATLTDLSRDRAEMEIVADSVIAPLHGQARDGLHRDVEALEPNARPGQILSVGDCASPRTALEAVFEGHEAARRI